MQKTLIFLLLFACKTPTSATEPPLGHEQDKAVELTAKASEFYQQGNYQEAETLLKASLSVYPFYAKANLLLGKVFLMQGTASQDKQLLQAAKLQFEMAQSLEPDNQEIKTLLELLQEKSKLR